MSFKIYTKTGDKGTTGLFGGARVSKHAIRIEAYGTTDELNSHTGLLRDQVEKEEIRSALLAVQHELFVIGSNLAKDPDSDLTVPALESGIVTSLEEAMDKMDNELAPLKSFILPGGHPIVSQAHICRVVCRRAERRVVALAETEVVPEEIVIFLNRLSDYFFVLARYLGKTLEVEEIKWQAKSPE
ncbi:MAG: cob(I)yrinic acid a,c-diamide adenosyltransferase [Saprospiraceae bacterium]|nr:cob(I)yrinic acid a,c-diamide adenosyltransferase [Saprospiraceae bacterium]